MQHLENYEYYSDLYDRIVVNSCLRIEKSILENKAIPPDKRPFVLKIILYPHRGEECLKKEGTIREWMERDEKRDRHFDRIQEPKNVLCILCKKPMELLDKTLKTDWEDARKDKVVFDFSCQYCKVIKTIDEYGQTSDEILWECPKCSGKMNLSSKRRNGKITSNSECPQCGYRNSYTLDLNKIRKKPSLEEVKKYNYDRHRFCMSDKELDEYREFAKNLQALKEIVDKGKERVKQMCLKIDKIGKTPPQKMASILKEALEDNDFSDFKLSKGASPSLFSFAAKDTAHRKAATAKRLLRWTIEDLTDETNWKLSEEKLTSKEGIITGKLVQLTQRKEICDLFIQRENYQEQRKGEREYYSQ